MIKKQKFWLLMAVMITAAFGLFAWAPAATEAPPETTPTEAEAPPPEEEPVEPEEPPPAKE